MLMFTFTSKGRENALAIQMIAFLIVGFSISLMVRILDGYASPYYAGLNLVFLAIAVLVPWGITVSLLVCSLIYASYIIPILVYDRISDVGVLVNNNFFMLSTIAVALTSNYFNSLLHYREFLARYDLERARDELKELDTLKSQFFSNVSHELRTPLTSIILPIRNILAEKGDVLDPENVAEKKVILRNAHKLLKRINEILDISKLEAGKMTIRAAPRNINGVLEDTLITFSAATQEMGLVLTFQPDPELSTVYIDTEKIEKVFANLISNALKFTNRGGKVEVSTKEVEDRIEVKVSDTGIGIAKEDIPHIFDRFHQVDGSSSRKYEGTGLGLYLVKELVEMHHGTVQVESEPGKGSAFTVYLLKGCGHFKPEEIEQADSGEDNGFVERRTGERRDQDRRQEDRRKADQEDRDTISLLQIQVSDLVQGEAYQVAESAECSNDDTRKGILIVEDNRDLAGNIARVLSKSYRVCIAGNGQEALDRIKEAVPDLVVTDVMMPEMDGYELTKRIRDTEETKHLPIVMLTAKVTIDAKIEGIQYGADHYLTKPFNPSELTVVVDSLLKRRQLENRLNESNTELKKALSDLKETQAQLVHTGKLASVGQLAAGVAHEIHTPALAVDSCFEVISDKAEKIKAGKATFEQIYPDITKFVKLGQESLNRIRDIVDALLGFSRKNREGFQYVDIHAGINDTLAVLGHELKDGVQIHTDYGPVGEIGADLQQLNQVFMNLLSNAIYAVKVKQEDGATCGNIWIKTYDNEDRIIISVRDDGIGIPADIRDRIYDPFFTTKDIGEGTGLGLNISYRIIQDHGGTMELESAENEGTTFTITLPKKERSIEKETG